MKGNELILAVIIVLLSCNSREKEESILLVGERLFYFDTFVEEDFKDKRIYRLFKAATAKSKDLDFDGANLLLQQALDLDPMNKMILNSLANNEAQLGNFEIAIALYRNAYQLDTAYFFAYTNIAAAYNDMKEFRKSIEACNYVLENDVQSLARSAAHYHKSIAEYELGQTDSAIYDIQKAIEHSNTPNITQKFSAVKEQWTSQRKLIDLLKDN